MSRLTQCWNHIRSEGLAQQFATWLLGDVGGPGTNIHSFFNLNLSFFTKLFMKFDCTLRIENTSICSTLNRYFICLFGYFNLFQQLLEMNNLVGTGGNIK